MGAMEVEPTERIDRAPPPSPVLYVILVASIAAGVQFGWALQLSLLTPYVQLLGVPHTCSAFIWLCGPLSGLLVQPTVGYYSDRCTSPFGRRRPFIVAGVALVTLSVFLIGFAADIGHACGDPLAAASKPRAIAIFVVGFWTLDVANNTLQGPCRAFLADLAADDHAKTGLANSLFAFFMAVGNVLGYAAGSLHHLHKIFPFSLTTACDVYCANLKSCFFLSILSLIVVTSLACFIVPDTPISTSDADKIYTGASFFAEIISAFKHLKKPMWLLLLVASLNWIAWFPFTLYDTDWMGREVYGGETGSRLYDLGVSAGSLGLLLNSVVFGIMSLLIEPLARLVGSPTRLWGIVNLLLAVCFGLMVVASKIAQHQRHLDFLAGAGNKLPPDSIKAFALALFSIMGVPLAVTFSIPFALASILSKSSGLGQGLSLGVLTLSIAIPQIFMSVTTGPWDALFGGGNLPAFVVGAVVAALSSILIFTVLPSPPPDAKLAVAGGH